MGIVIYLTGRRDESDESLPFLGGETNLLENSYNEKLLYTDDEGNFQDGSKPVFASVVPERGTALVFYQKGLLHEGADIAMADLPSTQPYLNKKIILRSDVFFKGILMQNLPLSVRNSKIRIAWLARQIAQWPI